VSKKKKILLVAIAVILFIIFWPWAFLAPHKGKVIDADTKEPIVGAAVLVVYSNFYPTVAGSISSVGDAQETLTDENGEFKIPWKVNLYGDAKFIPDGEVIIFKPGYGVLPSHKRSTAVGENKSWPPAFKNVVYEIQKLKTREEMRSNLPSRPEIPHEKMKTFVRLINEERINLGFSPLTIPEEGSLHFPRFSGHKSLTKKEGEDAKIQ